MNKLEILKKYNACQEGIHFFTRNSLHLQTILKSSSRVDYLRCVRYYNSNGNEIKRVCANGRIYVYLDDKLYRVYENNELILEMPGF